MNLWIDTIGSDSHTGGFEVSNVYIELFNSHRWDLWCVVNCDLLFAYSIDFPNDGMYVDGVFTLDG